MLLTYFFICIKYLIKSYMIILTLKWIFIAK